MKMPRNDLCRCGSGRKYKRCCLSGDEAAQREQQTSKAESLRAPGPQVDESVVWAALAKSVGAVTAKPDPADDMRADRMHASFCITT